MRASVIVKSLFVGVCGVYSKDFDTFAVDLSFPQRKNLQLSVVCGHLVTILRLANTNINSQ